MFERDLRSQHEICFNNQRSVTFCYSQTLHVINVNGELIKINLKCQIWNIIVISGTAGVAISLMDSLEVYIHS